MTTAPREAPAPPRVLLAHHHLRQLMLPTVLREYEKIAVEVSRARVTIMSATYSASSNSNSSTNEWTSVFGNQWHAGSLLD
jgi:hypothetical protein